MKKINAMVAFVFGFCLALPASASDSLQPLSQAWMGQKGDAYFQFQNELLDDSKMIGQWLKGSAEPAIYDSESWVDLVVEEATMLRLNQAELVERLYNLNGLRAENYLRWRRPEPAVLRELKPMKGIVASMMELYHLGFQSYPWSGPAYETSERLALEMGLLHAIGESDHPARVYFLTHVVESGFSSRAVRLSALSALAKTGSADALTVLTGMLAEAEHDVELKAWLAGSLGHIRSTDTWPLVEALLDDALPNVRQAALASVRLLLSRWHWDGRAQELELLRNKVSHVLVTLLEDPESMHASALGETLSLVGGNQLIDSLKTRVGDATLVQDVRLRMQSVLSQVERAERRRQN